MRSAAVIVSLCACAAFAQAPESRFSAGGYFRIMARPDFQGGNGNLGYWNLYGRLMNEGPYAGLEMKLDLLQAAPGSNDTWTSLYARVEGSSVSTADIGNGNLSNFRVSQLYALAGNIVAPNVVWQLGTLRYYFGYLGLYDFRVAEVFDDTVGLSGHYKGKNVDVLVGVGDSGFSVRGAQYVPLITGGGVVRAHLGDHVELGVGGQVAVEPFIQGNRFSSYVTPGVSYEDFFRHEVLQSYLAAHPADYELFPKPVPSTQLNVSWRGLGYLGFGKLGPLTWNTLAARLQRLHPQNFYTDTFGNQSVTVYTADLTRDRYVLQIGDEAQFKIVPDRLDVVWAGIYGTDRDYANTVAASEANREYLSTVLRAQVYLTRTTHLLFEGSYAHERSLNGNLFRSNFDSIFQSTAGLPDTRGLELGDASVRQTMQLKAGVVLNPTGFGIYARPSIRLLYGFQYSTQHAAFGNAFATRLDQYDAFQPTSSIHWHHLISLETEGWF